MLNHSPNSKCAAIVLALICPLLCLAAGRATTVAKASAELFTVLSLAKTAEQTAATANNPLTECAAPGESLYSVSLNFNRSSWSDWFSRPDLYLVVESEGNRRIVVPEIEYNWDYGPKIINFRCATLRPGAECVLRLYDDDSASDAVWRNILATRVPLTAAVSAKAVTPCEGYAALEAKATASGALQLLTAEEAERLTLDAADPMASAAFRIPQASAAKPWDLHGRFSQGATDFGRVSFSHWHTSSPHSLASRLLNPQFAFWSVLALGGVLVIGRRLRSSRQSKPREEPLHSNKVPFSKGGE